MVWDLMTTSPPGNFVARAEGGEDGGRRGRRTWEEGSGTDVVRAAVRLQITSNGAVVRGLATDLVVELPDKQ